MKSNIGGLAAAVFAVALGIFAAGCSGKTEGLPGTDNMVKIISMTPDISAVLQEGDKLDLEVTLEYRLKEENGSVSLVIQDDKNTPVGSLLEPVKKGSGKVTLKRTVTIPKTGAIAVFTPLSASGETRTETVDKRVFKVVAKK
jgi:hypothetical protein